MTNILCA